MAWNQIGTLHYYIQYPKEYCCTQKYPVLFFLHGAGTRGTNRSALTENPFFQITNRMALPFVVVAPLCHADSWFDLFSQVVALVDEIYEADFTDQAHFCAMGASMGGYGVWQLAMSRPTLFTAIVPICGGGMYWNASRFSDTPVWAFHGDQDQTVFCEESEKMVAAINRAGGNAKITIYENCGHDAWTATYSNQAVFDWMLSQSKRESVTKAPSLDDPFAFG